MRGLFRFPLVLGTAAWAVAFCLPWDRVVETGAAPPNRSNLWPTNYQLELGRSGLQYATGWDTRTVVGQLNSAHSGPAVGRRQELFLRGRPNFLPILLGVAGCALVALPAHYLGRWGRRVSLALLTASLALLGVGIAGYGGDMTPDMGEYPVRPLPPGGIEALDPMERAKWTLETMDLVEYSGLRRHDVVTSTPWRWVFAGGLLLAWVGALGGAVARGRPPAARRPSARDEGATKPCPHCGRRVPAYAEACRHCRRVLAAGGGAGGEPLGGP